MANLGSDNTPIEGESFGLPSGFSIDENNGNLAIRDTNGNVVAEWDETNTQWDFANNTLNNVGALNSNSVNTEELSNDTGLSVSRVPLSLQTPTIEDWGRQTLDYYAGNTGNLVFDSTETLQNDVSLRNNADGGNTLLSPFRINRGYRYRLYCRVDSHESQDVQLVDFCYGLEKDTFVKSAGDGYIFRFRNDATSEIRRSDAGVGSAIASTATDPPTDEWIIMEVGLDFGLISVRCLQLDGTEIFELTANDDTYQSTAWLQLDIRSDDSANGNYNYVDQITRRPL